MALKGSDAGIFIRLLTVILGAVLTMAMAALLTLTTWLFTTTQDLTVKFADFDARVSTLIASQAGDIGRLEIRMSEIEEADDQRRKHDRYPPSR